MDENLQRIRDDITGLNCVVDKIKDDILELRTADAETKVEIRVLCRDVQSLTSAIKWAGVSFITCFGGFFIWVIQQVINNQ